MMPGFPGGPPGPNPPYGAYGGLPMPMPMPMPGGMPMPLPLAGPMGMGAAYGPPPGFPPGPMGGLHGMPPLRNASAPSSAPPLGIPPMPASVATSGIVVAAAPPTRNPLTQSRPPSTTSAPAAMEAAASAARSTLLTPATTVLPSTPKPVAAPVAEKVTTIFVGKIPTGIDDSKLRQILSSCGTVSSWKRMTTFGFCDYDTIEQVKRAHRLLNGLRIEDQELLIKIDEKTQKYIDEQKEAESKEVQDKLDLEAKQILEGILGKKAIKESVPESPLSPGSSQDPNKAAAMSKEMVKFREKQKELESRVEQDTEKRSREREKEKDKEHEKDKAEAEYRRREQKWEQYERDREAERRREQEKEDRRIKEREVLRIRYILNEYDSSDDERTSERYLRSHKDQLRRRWRRERHEDQALIEQEIRKQAELAMITSGQSTEAQLFDGQIVPEHAVVISQSESVPAPPISEVAPDPDGLSTLSTVSNAVEESSEQSRPTAPSFSLSLKKGGPPMSVTTQMADNSEPKKRVASNIFTQEEAEETPKAPKRRASMGPSDDRRSEVSTSTDATTLSTTSKQSKLTAEEMKKIIDSIPKGKEGLFAMALNWDLTLSGEIMPKIRDYVSKKIADYLGFQDESITNIVLDKLRKRISPQALTEELLGLLEKDTDNFVVMLWRKMLFETLCVQG